MLISELLSEAFRPPVIIRTDRFIREAGKMIDAGLTSRLAHWLSRKQAEPLVLHGNNDKPSRYSLVGWNHFHLRHGQVLIHYKATSQYILLVAVTDHKAVDGGTDENRRFSNYLDNLDVNRIVAQSLQLEPALEPVLSAAQKQEANSLIYNLAYDSGMRPELEQFAHTGIMGDLKDWWLLKDLPMDPGSVEEYQALAKHAIRTTKAVH